MNEIRAALEDIADVVEEKIKQGDYPSQAEAFHLRKCIMSLRQQALAMRNERK